MTMTDAAEATILVTGATDGLGRRVAQELAAMGAKVLLHGRSPQRLEATREELRGCADRRVANVSMGDEEPT
jgi:short-subunit dehydrogenase